MQIGEGQGVARQVRIRIQETLQRAQSGLDLRQSRGDGFLVGMYLDSPRLENGHKNDGRCS